MRKVLGFLTGLVLGCSSALAQNFLGQLPTDSLVGRDTAGTGQAESITLGTGLAFSGSRTLLFNTAIIDTSAELRAIITDETGTGFLMFGLSTDMSDGLACGPLDVIRRNAGDNAFECAAAGGGGDNVQVEDGDNTNAFTGIDTTANFEDSGDINFVFTDGGAGGPDAISALVRADSVALTTDTTGNYAAGDAEAGAALTGDSATGFFSAGTIEDARIDGSAEADELVLAGDVDGTANANDIDEAAIEAEIEGVIDTLASLTSIQNLTVTLADAGVNAFFGWDDVAGAYENLTTAEFEALVEAAVELADLQGSLTLAGDVDGAHGTNDLDEANVEVELEGVLDLADLQGDLALGTKTSGNYVDDVTAGTGISVTHTPGEGSDAAIAFNYGDAGADPALNGEECRFTNDTTTAGVLVCEGDTANASESRIDITEPTADRVMTIPNADSNPVRPLSCGGTDKVSAIAADGTITCSADEGGAGSGDNIRVEDADNAGTFTAAADADFSDEGDINFELNATPSPDAITGIVRPDSVALTTDTTGNYAAGDGEAGAALTGDSATAFFSAGTIEDARIDGSAEADELVLAGDVDGTANANDLDEANVEVELEGVLDLADMQGDLALGTKTSGNYVLDVADGTGIDGTAAGEGATYTPTLDLTEINSATWGNAGGFTAFTFDAGATDPVLTFGSGTLTLSAMTQLNLDDEGEFRLFEEDAGGANYKGFKSPAAVTANTTCTFEDDANFIPDSCVGDGTDDDVPESADVVLAGDVDGNFDSNDIDEAAIEAEIEPTLDTLANLTSIQSLTVTLADAGADAILGWDDSAAAYENLTQAEVLAVIGASSETAQGVIELATTAEAETGTDTTRAVTAAGVLAAVTGKKPIWLPAGSLTPRTTNGCAVTDLELGTNDIMTRACYYDQTTEEGAGFHIRMPDTWNEGTVTFVPTWAHPATATNFGVVWSMSCLATSNDDALDAALGTPQTSTDTGGTTTDAYIGPESAAITCAGTPQAGDLVYFEVERTPGAGSDTLAVDAYLLGVTIYYTDNAFVEP